MPGAQVGAGRSVVDWMREWVVVAMLAGGLNSQVSEGAGVRPRRVVGVVAWLAGD